MSKINVFVNGQRKGWLTVSVYNSKIGWVFNHPTWGLIILSRKTGKDYFFDSLSTVGYPNDRPI